MTVRTLKPQAALRVVAPASREGTVAGEVPASGEAPASAPLQRAKGTARVTFKPSPRGSVLDELFQSGCLKVRLPRSVRGAPEAILVNTSGGLTDGDQLSIAAEWRPGTTATVTTQACERIYRSRSASARIETRLSLGAGASAFWLPQETILFDGGRLERRTRVSLAASARLVACEAVILGRPAMGERVTSGLLHDSWQIEREGRLIFADRLGLEGDPAASLDRLALGNGARAFASVIVCTPESGEIRDRLQPLLAGLAAKRPGVMAGCSDLANGDSMGGVVLARLLAPSGHDLRAVLMPLLEDLCRARADAVSAAGLPRVWSC